MVISGPSGVGKSCIRQEVLRRTGALWSVSATTRSPRPGEVDGKDYRFVTRERFEQMIAQDELLEWADVFGNYYGTPIEPVWQAIKSGQTMLMEIDVQGGAQVYAKLPGETFILILPPSMDELRRRLAGRGTEPPEVIDRRFAKAQQEILAAQACGAYTYRIVNDDLERAIQQVIAIMNTPRPGQAAAGA